MMALNIASVFRLGVQVVAGGFAQTATKISRIESQAKRAGASIDNSVRQLNSRLATLGTTAAIAGGALLGVASVAASATLEIERMATSVDIVGRSAGFATSEIHAMTAAIEAQNFTQATALKTVIDLTGAMVDFVDVTQLGQIAQDIATAKNADAAKILDTLSESIAKGSVRQLQSLELGSKNSELIKATIKAMEGEVKGLTKLQQQQAVWNAILRIGTRFQGAYESASETASRAIELFKLSLDRARVSMGKGVLEALIPLIKRTTELIDKFNELPEATKNLIGRIVAISGAIISLVGVMALLAPVFSTIAPAIKSSIAGFKNFTAGIKAGSVIAKTYTAAQLKLIPGLKGVGVSIGKVAAALGPWGIALAAVTGLVLLFRKEIGAAVSTLKDDLQPALDKAKEFLKSLADSFIVVRAAVSVMVDAVKNAVSVVLNFLVGLISGPLGELGDKIGEAVVPNFRELLETFFVGGFKMMGAFAAGIIEGATEVILAITAVVQAISEFLIGASPPPKGPLSDIDQAGFDLIAAWVEGMYQFPADALKGLAENVARQLKEALFIISQDLFELESQLLKLERAIDPLRDALFIIEEEAKLILIPLDRQRRELGRQLSVIKDIADAEDKRRKKQIDAFKEQIEGAEKLLKLQRDRLELVDHELFIEQIRNKITGQAGTIRSLALTSQLRLQKDVVARAEERIRKMREELEDREKAAKAQKELFDKQIEALELQIKAIDKLVEIEQERIKFAQEEVELAQALQAEERLLIRQRTRALEDQQRILQNMADIVAQLFFTPKGPKPKKPKIEPFVEGIDSLFERAREGIDDMQEGFNNIDFEALKTKMKAAFDEQTKDAKAAFDTAFAALQTAWDDLKVQVDVVFEKPTDEALDILFDAIWSVFVRKGKEAFVSIFSLPELDEALLERDREFNERFTPTLEDYELAWKSIQDYWKKTFLPGLAKMDEHLLEQDEQFNENYVPTLESVELAWKSIQDYWKKTFIPGISTLNEDLLEQDTQFNETYTPTLADVELAWKSIQDYWKETFIPGISTMNTNMMEQDRQFNETYIPTLEDVKLTWKTITDFWNGPVKEGFASVMEKLVGQDTFLRDDLIKRVEAFKTAWDLVVTGEKAFVTYWETKFKEALTKIKDFIHTHFVAEDSTLMKFAKVLEGPVVTAIDLVRGAIDLLLGPLRAAVALIEKLTGIDIDFDSGVGSAPPGPTADESTKPKTPRPPFERGVPEDVEVAGPSPTSGRVGRDNTGGTRDSPFATVPSGTGLGGGGGFGSSSVNMVVNNSTLNVRANYANNQSEASILNDMQLLQIMAA